MSPRCGVTHPQDTGRECILPGGTHGDHADAQGSWPNPEVVAQMAQRASRTVDRKRGRGVLGDFAQNAARPRQTSSQVLTQSEGMAASYEASSEEFRTQAWNAIEHLARTRPEITTDDVWGLLAERGVDTEHRASMGTLVKQAAKRGWLTKTDQMVATQRHTQRAHGLIVWRSMIYQEGSPSDH